MRFVFLQQVGLQHGLFVPALGVLGEAFVAFLHRFEVGQHQFRRHDLDVTNWVDAPGHVMHVRILKAADDMHDRIHLPDMAEELVAKSLTFAKRPLPARRCPQTRSWSG